MARPIWKGDIAFGLVHVPVQLYPAEQHSDISFHLVDSRNSARIRYERINEETGEEVPWNKVVKAYEYENGNYVVLTEKEMERAAVEMTRSIEIEQFVDLSKISSTYFDKPYYVVPAKGGEKGYVLLREAMAKSNRAGIARVVIRARQHLAALLPQEEALILELLRFPQELKKAEEFDFPAPGAKRFKIRQQELELAEQLIDGMTEPWKPSQYHDEYRDVLRKLIASKIKSGETEEVFEEEELPEAERSTVNFMEALKRSLKKPAERETHHRRKPAGRRTAGHRRKAAS